MRGYPGLAGASPYLLPEEEGQRNGVPVLCVALGLPEFLNRTLGGDELKAFHLLAFLNLASSLA